ncbi:MAG TPA: phosphate regulon sensor histidine kinase PhoR [Burkholderiales bacterium]|nr:phosphate regulon sensor histidine kinase PhoR [Burkholderiales bacterium]
MSRLWGRPLLGLVLVVGLSLLIWPLFGRTAALGACGLMLVVLLLHHLSNLSRLHQWLADAAPNTLPDGTGAWEEIFSGLRRLLRRQTQIESRLSAALTRFQRAGAALPEGVVVLDERDRIEWCNPRAENHFGLDHERDRNQQITNLIRNPDFVSYLNAGSFNEPLILRLQRSEGDLVLSIQLVPYGSSQKLLLSRDITHWERMETTRRDFVANVSHELRTPLTVLAGFLETLIDMPEPDREMTNRSLVLMSEQTVRMHRLVEDLLTLSRLESTAHPLHEEEVDVAEMMVSLEREANTLSGGQHAIKVTVDNHDRVMGSVDEIRSAFTNLVSNAVRYTPSGGEIEMAWKRRDGFRVFSVTDSGIGIEPQHLPRLTERFYRVDRSRSRSTGGTGLGLAIVKHVLSRHDAQLEIESEMGKGSTFRAVFPKSRIALEGSRSIERAHF